VTASPPSGTQPWLAGAVAQAELADVTLMAEDLAFPEGPVAMADGSVLLTEIEGSRITRVAADGSVDVVAQCEGGPNGAAFGPDGALYVCNNGGRYAAGNWTKGWVDRVDPSTGRVDLLYDAFEGRRLSGPNDIVFDESGGFWFTDLGKTRGLERDLGAIYYASPDGSSLTRAVFPAEMPNGIGLSPDGGTVYYAETGTARLRARRIDGPGAVAPLEGHGEASVLAGLPGLQGFDSLAVDGAGNICVATLITGGITVIAPDSSSVVHYSLGEPFFDAMTTNICFGGPDLRTAYIPLGATGRLVRCPWPEPGLRLAFNG